MKDCPAGNTDIAYKAMSELDSPASIKGLNRISNVEAR